MALATGVCFYVDELVADLVVAMNAAGVTTHYSCHGGDLSSRTGEPQPAYVALAGQDDWVAMMGRLYDASDAMAFDERGLLTRIGGLTTFTDGTPSRWHYETFLRDRNGGFLELEPTGHSVGHVSLYLDLVLRFPTRDAAAAARLITTYGTPTPA